jgi:hypothetical protein
MAGAWFLIWVLALVWAAAAVPAANAGMDPSQGIVRGGLTLAVGSVLLLVCGYLLAHAGRWVYVAALTLYVWGLLLAWYIGAMLMTTPAADGSDNDNAAGAGLVILGVPGLFVVAALVGLGAGVGAVVRALAQRRRRALELAR